MRAFVLLAAATLTATGAAIPFATPAFGQPKPQGVPQAQVGAMAAQVRAGVDAWSAGNYEAAVKAWQGPAAKGDADALFNLGQAYKLGRGVPKDLARAEAMYGKAARLGNVRAADNYGILLFQTNRQQAAIPWLQAAADRGEPRAMYVLGIASYNGDYAPKDWVRAYALITRAAGAGLAQAVTSLSTMNETIPLAQRQMGISLAGDLEQQAADARGRELAAADLGSAPVRPVAPVPAPPPPPKPLPKQLPKQLPGGIERVDLPPSTPVVAAGSEPPSTGPDDAFAPPRPGAPVVAPPKPLPSKPSPPKPPASQPSPVRLAAPKPAPDAGPWRIQLGAFGQKANADALWNRVRTRAEIAGHGRADLGSPVARLLATGYSESGAQRACAALKAGGFACLVINP
ncbi:MAG: SPOR domain-containing protein [Novosphingobium sp.]